MTTCRHGNGLDVWCHACLEEQEARGSERHVATLRLPIGCMTLVPLTHLLETIYGEGLVAREEPKGWLRIEKPSAPDAQTP